MLAVNPVAPSLGGIEETERGFAPLHARMGGTGDIPIHFLFEKEGFQGVADAGQAWSRRMASLRRGGGTWGKKEGA
jgi:hypothetical protein